MKNRHFQSVASFSHVFSQRSIPIQFFRHFFFHLFSCETDKNLFGYDCKHSLCYERLIFNEWCCLCLFLTKVTSILAMPLWQMCIVRFGKNKTFAAGMMVRFSFSLWSVVFVSVKRKFNEISCIYQCICWDSRYSS